LKKKLETKRLKFTQILRYERRQQQLAKRREAFMLHAIHWHLSEELLDEYVRRKLSSEDAIAFVEEHLLVCDRCREVVSETDDLVNALRYAFSAAEEFL
jgi:hypothetical protein